MGNANKLGTVEPVQSISNPENGDWNHRSELSLTDKQRAISQVVEENRHGEVEVPRFDEEPDESEKHVDNEPKEMSEDEEKAKLAAKYAAKYDHHTS